MSGSLPSGPVCWLCSARTNAAGAFLGASKYQVSSGRRCQIRAFSTSSSANRKIGLQQVLEVAVFIARLAVDQQNLELLLADVDRADDLVVIRLEFARPGRDLQDVRDVPGLLGPVADLDPRRLAVGRGLDRDRLDL